MLDMCMVCVSLCVVVCVVVCSCVRGVVLCCVFGCVCVSHTPLKITVYMYHQDVHVGVTLFGL